MEGRSLEMWKGDYCVEVWYTLTYGEVIIGAATYSLTRAARTPQCIYVSVGRIKNPHVRLPHRIPRETKYKLIQ